MRGKTQTLPHSGRFIKSFDPSEIHLEYEKYRQLWQIGEANGFKAPKPLEVRLAQGEIAYEFLPRLHSVREPYLELMQSSHPSTEAGSLLRRAGQALAHLHSHLEMTETRSWSMPETFAGALRKIGGAEWPEFFARSEQAVLHGDYGFSNVNVTRTDGGEQVIVVLDPSPNLYVSFHPNAQGSIYLDLAHFLSCLDGLVSIRHYWHMQWSRLQDVKELFLQGYETTAGVSLDRRRLDLLAFATATAYFDSLYGPGLRSRLAIRLLYNKWKGNLP